MVQIALYQPDIPQNVGAAMRLCACTGTALGIIEPCGFPWDLKKMQRAGMDYMDIVNLTRHDSWAAFTQSFESKRLVLMTTKTDQSFYDFDFSPNDILIAGQESAGVPPDVHHYIPHHVTIPMNGAARSMNVINATAMILSEAIRQTRYK